MARQPKRRRRYRITREGKLFLLVTVGIGLASINTGNNLMYLAFGLLLSLLLLSGVMSEIVLLRVRLGRTLPHRAFVGAPYIAEVVADNRKKRLSSYALEVADVAEGETASAQCHFLKIGPGVASAATYSRVPQKRGWLELRELRLSTTYPFGLIEKTDIRPTTDTVLVYPALLPEPGHAFLPDARADEQQVVVQPVGVVGTEVAGIRAHRPEDSARVIHWRRSAALGRLVVREHDREQGTHVAIRVDNGAPANRDQRWNDELERAISRAATLARQLVVEGHSVRIVARGSASPRVASQHSADPLFHFLALLPVTSASTPWIELRGETVLEVAP